MGYRNLQESVVDLEKHNELKRIDIPLSANLDIGMIQRRVYAAGGPALLFTHVEGSAFPMLGNLFGTLDRTRFIFRDSLKTIESLVRLKLNPVDFIKNPLRHLKAPAGAWHLLPKKVAAGPVMEGTTTLNQLPQLKSWPDDGGAFITLPQVYSENPAQPGMRHGNLGMYRIQISGNDYSNREAGVHYQLHRGIGVHHAKAGEENQPLRVNVFVGGAPAMTVAAVMPLPEGMPEMAFAGLLGGQRIATIHKPGQLPVPAEADFCICGTIDPTETRPEGPFGDHFGYYSLVHPFPVLRVDKVYHRKDAIWPFTTVGRPPQEDTSFGAFIHELTGDLIPSVLPGIEAVHAVDAAGVHPLLLAIGSERYLPYASPRKPQELLTLANAILGQGQLSLAKYLFIVAREDAPDLSIHNIADFFRHILERVDWQRDLHFQTQTTIDTLDYSGSGFNEGSKLVVAVAGEKRRDLPDTLPENLLLPAGFSTPRVVLPGILAIQAPPCLSEQDRHSVCDRFCASWQADHPVNGFPLILLVDDSDSLAAELNNFLWTVFTCSSPAEDTYGIGAETCNKHWGCKGSLVIDTRRKPHHAPALIEDPEAVKRVEALAVAGAPLHGLF